MSSPPEARHGACLLLFFAVTAKDIANHNEPFDSLGRIKDYSKRGRGGAGSALRGGELPLRFISELLRYHEKIAQQ